MNGGPPPHRQSPSEAAALWVTRMNDRPLTVDEQMALGHWLAADASHRIELDAIRSLWDEPELVEALGPYRGANESEIVPASIAPRPFWARLPVAPRYAAGAGAAIAAVFALAMVLSPVRPIAPFGKVAAPTLVETVPGQLRQVSLADGSTAALNGGTRLHVQFDAHERRLKLEDGEAFFDVAHDSAHPFVVRAGNVRFTAVGTRFSVTTFSERTILLVSQGRVRVSSDVEGVPSHVYPAGAQVIVSTGGHSVVNSVPVATQPSWQEGWLDTEALSVADLVTTLNRRTGSTIAVAPEVANLMVTGRFRIDRSDELLHSLKLMHQLKLESRGGRTVLIADGSRPSP